MVCRWVKSLIPSICSHIRSSDTLKLGGIERTLTKVDDQGNSAITYKVNEGWPDPATHANVVAFAKKGKSAYIIRSPLR